MDDVLNGEDCAYEPVVMAQVEPQHVVHSAGGATQPGTPPCPGTLSDRDVAGSSGFDRPVIGVINNAACFVCLDLIPLHDPLNSRS